MTEWMQTTKCHDDWYKPTPRVAAGLSDLRIGQVIAYNDPAHGGWSVHEVGSGNATLDGDWDESDFPKGRCVILSDPPPEPIAVSRQLIDLLIQAWDNEDQSAMNTQMQVLAEIREATP